MLKARTHVGIGRREFLGSLIVDFFLQGGWLDLWDTTRRIVVQFGLQILHQLSCTMSLDFLLKCYC